MSTPMLPSPSPSQPAATAAHPVNWVVNASVLWLHRRTLFYATVLALFAGLAIALAIPKRYQSVARIMPPDQQGSSAMLLAALTSRSSGSGLGGLSSLAGGLLGGHTTTALFVDLLRSGTVSGHLVDRFNLKSVYHKRYLVDTAKHLAQRTEISDDKKSGVITIAVEDTDPVRARDLAEGYLVELNNLVTQTSTSSAHQERIFIEKRLHSVEADLEHAQLELSEFSSTHSTVDIKEQTRASVDAGAKVQGQLLVEQAELDSMRQIYGDSNVRVRETEAAIAALRHDLDRMNGSSAPLSPATGASQSTMSQDDLSPPLRQLPRLAVPFADLYRNVRVQETVFELLTQQYEMARIEEAKDLPVVSVIDAPGIPEKKSFPPRLLVALGFAVFGFTATSAWLLLSNRWTAINPFDPRKQFAQEIRANLRQGIHGLLRLNGRPR
jgi:capsule polysaccharide export protein KpsE/RkpR